MRWQDDAIILSVRKFSEHAGVIHLFARERGAYRGMSKYAMSKKHRGTFQPGNFIKANWSARLEEHMGTLTCELNHPYAALIMNNAKALNALLAACSLCELAMHERDPHPALYDALFALLTALEQHQTQPLQWIKAYAIFEWVLLRETGFGLDISRCAATDTTENLIYLSPKSGRAVCEEAGKPYDDKMFRIPNFIRNEVDATPEDIAETLRITNHFMREWLLPAIHKDMPSARDRCVEGIGKLLN